MYDQLSTVGYWLEVSWDAGKGPSCEDLQVPQPRVSCFYGYQWSNNYLKSGGSSMWITVATPVLRRAQLSTQNGTLLRLRQVQSGDAAEMCCLEMVQSSHRAAAAKVPSALPKKAEKRDSGRIEGSGILLVWGDWHLSLLAVSSSLTQHGPCQGALMEQDIQGPQ